MVAEKRTEGKQQLMSDMKIFNFNLLSKERKGSPQFSGFFYVKLCIRTRKTN